MNVESPLYDIEDIVNTSDGPRIVCGRKYQEWWWKDGVSKSWIYHCQPFEVDPKTEALKRTGNENGYSKGLIHGKL